MVNTEKTEEEETKNKEEETTDKEQEEIFLEYYNLVNYLRLRTSELLSPAEAEAEQQQRSTSSSCSIIFPLLVSANRLFEKNSHLSFTDFSDYNSYFLHLPETKNMRFCGSSEGWLIMVSTTVGLARIFLFQPFSRAFIELPQGSNSPIIPERYSRPPPPTGNNTNRPATAPYFIRKAILSSSPSVSNQDWAVAAIDSSGKLFFYYHDRNQQSNYWISSKEDDYEARGGRVRTFEDVIFYQGKFYALQTNGSVTAYNIRGSDSGVTLNFIGGYETGFTNYLVEAKGEFLMVSRMCYEVDYGDARAYLTHNFNVFRLVARYIPSAAAGGMGMRTEGTGKWVKVEDTEQLLGDQVLFLGAGCSKSVNVVDCPGYKANHIYFSDDNFHRYYDLGMPFMCDGNGEFSMDTGECWDTLSPNTTSPDSPPIWFHASPTMVNP